MLAVELRINQAAVADFVRIFRIELQQHFACAQGQLHLTLFHQRRLQRIQELADHFGVIGFIEIFIEQLSYRADVAFQPDVQRMLIQRVAVKRID